MENKKFEIKEEHLKLIKRMYVSWEDCEFGAPRIDCKRPYGNSDVYQDIIEILGLEEISEGVFRFIFKNKEWLLKGEDKYNLYLDGTDEEKLCKELRILHKETGIALQICLRTQSFDLGYYEAEAYSQEWIKCVK